MKTNEQVLRYISQCEFSNEDWQKVLSYCRNRFGGGKAHKALNPLPNSQSTYDEFLNWIDNGIGVGDIVRYGHTIGIVGAYTPGYTRLGAYLSFDGQLINDTMEIAKDKIYKANDSEIALMKQKLIANALEFSVSLSACVKVYQPKGGDIVRITQGNIRTTAIFRSNDGQFNYFYVYIDRDNVIKDKGVLIGSVAMSLPTKSDIQRLLITLAKNKLEWSARLRVLRSVELSRAAKNGRYWYVGDRFSVCSDVDKYTKLHNERHKCGNYFISYQTAILFAQKVQDLRKEIAGAK